MNSSNFPMPAIDLSGKLIIKAQLGNDIRKIPIHNEEITYDELLLMMQRLFCERIRSSDEITIKYKDEDGDLITIFDSSDLMFAKSLSRYLKLTLFVNGIPQPLESDQIKGLKNELINMRDKINTLISRLDSFSQDGTNNDQFYRKTEERDERTSPKKPTPHVSLQQATEDSRMNAALFDPLKKSVEADSTTAGDPFSSIGRSQSVSNYSQAPDIASEQTSYSDAVYQQQPQNSYPSICTNQCGSNESSYYGNAQPQPYSNQQAPQQTQPRSQQYAANPSFSGQQQQPPSQPQPQQPPQPPKQQPLQQQQQPGQIYFNPSHPAPAQQTTGYSASYSGNDPSAYPTVNQATANPNRTMSPSPGRYQHPSQQSYDYNVQQPQQQQRYYFG